MRKLTIAPGQGVDLRPSPQRRSLATGARVAASVALLLLATTTAQAAPPKCERSPTPNVGPKSADNLLMGVAVVRNNSIWAVGKSLGDSDGGRAVIEYWNGVSWGSVPVPAPGGEDSFHGLNAVDTVGITDAWAVGSYEEGAGTYWYRPLILHYTGKPGETDWTVVPPPTTTDTRVDSALLDVKMFGPSLGWAVGSKGIDDRSEPLILRWDGTRWKEVPSPKVKKAFASTLEAVAIVNADEAWAVGWSEVTDVGPRRPLIMHWKNGRWGIVVDKRTRGPGYSSGLEDVMVVNGTVWAVGGDYPGDGSAKTFILRRQGGSWRRVPSPNASSHSELYGLAAQSASRLWAVGYSIIARKAKALVMRWDGRAWKLVDWATAPRMSYLYDAERVPGSPMIWGVGMTARGYGRTLAAWCF